MAQWLNDKEQKHRRMRQVNISAHNNVRTINSEQNMSAQIKYVLVADKTSGSLRRMI